MASVRQYVAATLLTLGPTIGLVTLGLLQRTKNTLVACGLIVILCAALGLTVCTMMIISAFLGI